MSHYRVRLTAAARRDISKLPEPVAWAVMRFCSGPLADNPYRVGKPLRGQLAGWHSARRGEYRIVYSIFDEEIRVDVVSIGRRSAIHRPR